MANLKPTFSLTLGSLNSTTANPAGGAYAFLVERDMDVAADVCQVWLTDRSGVSLEDTLTLELGHDEENEQVFTGRVVSVQPALDEVRVLALGKMEGLLNLRTANTYEGQSAGAIAQDLIGQASLQAGTVDDGPSLPRYAVDKRVSAYAHLRELAERLGFELYTNRQGEIMFHALGPAANLDAMGGLAGAAGGLAAGLLGGGEGYQFGKHLIAAQATSQPVAWGEVVVGGESPMSSQGDSSAHWLTINDQNVRGTAGSGEPGRLWLDPAARSKDLADRFAAGRLAVAQRVAHQVSIRVLGRPQVDLGDDLNVDETADDLLNGSGYVRFIRHRFDARHGYLTDFRISVAVSE